MSKIPRHKHIDNLWFAFYDNNAFPPKDNIASLFCSELCIDDLDYIVKAGTYRQDITEASIKEIFERTILGKNEKEV
jgi:hypothetical protein